MSRVTQVMNELKVQELDAILITNPYNLRYLSNFTGTAGLALITQEKAYFITDFRYKEQAVEQATDFEIVIHTESIYQKVGDIIQRDGLKDVGFEEEVVTISVYSELEEVAGNTHWAPSSGLIEELREVKDESELVLIRKAVEIAEAGFAHILDYIKPGQTEIEVANELDFYMRSQGASGVSFDTIVASGVRSAMPHGVASDKVIEKGDMITIDFGCYYEGYASDMTRTFAIGDPGDELKKIYEIVKEANERVTKAARPGMTGKELDAVARDYITAQGYGKEFGHTTGHGLGLEVHEGPSVSHRNTEKLVPGNVVTNEPGIYRSGLGGVRIEDDLVITAEGVENLMTTPKEFIQL